MIQAEESLGEIAELKSDLSSDSAQTLASKSI